MTSGQYIRNTHKQTIRVDNTRSCHSPRAWLLLWQESHHSTATPRPETTLFPGLLQEPSCDARARLVRRSATRLRTAVPVSKVVVLIHVGYMGNAPSSSLTT